MTNLLISRARENRTAHAVIAREQAPASASQDMFKAGASSIAGSSQYSTLVGGVSLLQTWLRALLLFYSIHILNLVIVNTKHF